MRLKDITGGTQASLILSENCLENTKTTKRRKNLMKILERISTPTRCYTKWDDEGFVGTGVKIRTWEERVQALEKLGADRSDAQAVIDAEDIVNRGMQAETFAFSMQWNRQKRLDKARQTMVSHIAKKGNS
jgi:hypothetical protein